MPHTIQQHSAGCVVFKRQDHQLLYLLGQHSGYHKWVLPKGLIEPEEQPQDAALREVREETGIIAALISQQPIHQDTYWFITDQTSNRSGNPQTPNPKNYPENQTTNPLPDNQKIRVNKTVTWFLAEYQSGSLDNHSWEVSQASWEPIDQALKLLAFPGERTAINQAHQYLIAIK